MLRRSASANQSCLDWEARCGSWDSACLLSAWKQLLIASLQGSNESSDDEGPRQCQSPSSFGDTEDAGITDPGITEAYRTEFSNNSDEPASRRPLNLEEGDAMISRKMSMGSTAFWDPPDLQVNVATCAHSLFRLPITVSSLCPPGPSHQGSLNLSLWSPSISRCGGCSMFVAATACGLNCLLKSL